MKSDLKITTTGGGTTSTTTISYINPEVSNETLAEFASKLVGLTNNTYKEANRVTTINVDTEDSTPSDKQVPTLSVTPTTLTTSANSNTSATVTYDGDGQLYLYDFNPNGIVASLRGNVIIITALSTATAGQYSLKVGATASTTSLAAVPVTIPVTVTPYEPTPT